MMDIFLEHIDWIWLPIGWFAVHKQHRLKTTVFIMACILTLRLQVELFEEIGHPTGVLPWSLMESHVLDRGQIVYAVFIMLFLIMAHFSARTDKIIFFAACLSVYFATLLISTLIMLL